MITESLTDGSYAPRKRLMGFSDGIQIATR